MKTLITLSIFSLLAMTTQAQDNRYEQTMQRHVQTLDTANSIPSLQDLANKFERISNAEEAQWLPAYYAAYCYVNLARLHGEGDKEKIDPMLDKAESFIATANERGGDESELLTLEGYAAQMRIMVDPMTRGQEYGPKVGKKLSMAMAANPDNPRPHMLMGINVMHTPEQYGGGAEKARPHLDKAVALFDQSENMATIQPHWGKETASYMLKECEKRMGK